VSHLLEQIENGFFERRLLVYSSRKQQPFSWPLSVLRDA
jgi:hypothetical protein